MKVKTFQSVHIAMKLVAYQHGIPLKGAVLSVVEK